MERKFSQYIALSSALRRAKVPNYGAVSTLLLECFIEEMGRLSASKVVARGVCVEGKFTEWRDEMVRGGWLIWTQNQADKGKYFAGKRLSQYLNNEKYAAKELVSRDEVPSKEEFEALKDEVEKIKASMKEIYESLELGEPDPPVYKKLKEKTGYSIQN